MKPNVPDVPDDFWLPCENYIAPASCKDMFDTNPDMCVPCQARMAVLQHIVVHVVGEQVAENVVDANAEKIADVLIVLNTKPDRCNAPLSFEQMADQRDGTPIGTAQCKRGESHDGDHSPYFSPEGVAGLRARLNRALGVKS